MRMRPIDSVAFGRALRGHVSDATLQRHIASIINRTRRDMTPTERASLIERAARIVEREATRWD